MPRPQNVLLRAQAHDGVRPILPIEADVRLGGSLPRRGGPSRRSREGTALTLAPLPADPAPESQALERLPRSKRWRLDAGPGRRDRGRTALVVAHPGHELRVHGWIEAARPLMHVLTDGSGSSGRSRLESTRRVLGPTGAEPASIFGRLSDVGLYEAIIDADHGLFVRLAEELAEALDAAEVEVVVGDAAEGYNPGHDACRLVIDAAVALVNRRRTHPLASFDFTLCHDQDRCPQALGLRALRLELTADAFERKLAA